ncbi:hypothetical protein CEXT_778081 [Caerostris extrusa]|uniref:Uncharacterized protein n=1 Tax=Caerostris extrusa TaxID=172846 RepID=A0AAV4RAX8_CAEEX|nr:hypothetical protein CEXT_778081 [Caerostris extrusa]
MIGHSLRNLKPIVGDLRLYKRRRSLPTFSEATVTVDSLPSDIFGTGHPSNDTEYLQNIEGQPKLHSSYVRTGMRMRQKLQPIHIKNTTCQYKNQTQSDEE